MLIADPQLGVIADARRRQWRRRTAVALLALAALVAFVLGGDPAGPPRPPAHLASSLRYLDGPALPAHSGLRLIAAENGGRPSLIDLDRGTAQPVTGLALPATVGAPFRTSVYPLVPYGAGALAFVTTQPCTRCGSTQVEYLIDREGRSRRLATRSLGYHQTFTPAPGSTAGWVSTWPHRGPCSLALEPGSRPAVRVPCGALVDVTSAGAWIRNGNVLMLVDPASGRERMRIRTAADVQLVRGSLALTSSPSPGAHALALVDLRTGARRQLRWPSALHFGYQAIPQRNGPLVALRFGQPYYPPSQAVDVWVLDTRSGALTHVPGFPALELLKFSTVAWTASGSLVVASKGRTRTVVGLWRPGAAALAVRAVPALEGYSSIVALTPR